MEEIAPAVNNDTKIAIILRKSAAELFPEGEIVNGYQTMGSEDMAYLMQKIPGCYALIGSADPGRGLDAKHHQNEFDFDEGALVHGAALLVSAVQKLKND